MASPSRLCRRLGRAAACLALCALLPAPPARGASLAGVAGIEKEQAGQGQRTRGALLAGVARFDAGPELLLAATRFDDAQVGSGTGATAGLGFPVGGPTLLRVQGTRFIGDGDWRAWRVKAGPGLSFAGGDGTAQLWLVAFQDNAGQRAQAAAFELEAPMVPKLAGTLGLSLARGSGTQDVTGAQASAGLAWTALPGLRLSGEVGMASSGAMITTTSPGSPGLPLLGGGHPGHTETTGTTSLSPTTRVAVRTFLPW